MLLNVRNLKKLTSFKYKYVYTNRELNSIKYFSAKK